MYHFHQFQIISPDEFVDSTGYFIPPEAHRIIYQPYIELINRAIGSIKHIQPDFNYGFSHMSPESRWKDNVKKLLLPIYWKLHG